MGYGFNVHMPQSSLPPGLDQCVLQVWVSFTGQYRLPSGYDLVSPVFWVRANPQCRFAPKLTIEIQHCAKITRSTKLSFVRADCSQESLPYVFKRLEGRGSFSEQSSYGSLELDHF